MYDEIKHLREKLAERDLKIASLEAENMELREMVAVSHQREQEARNASSHPDAGQ